MSKVQNPLPCGCAVVGKMDLDNAYDDGHCLHVPHKDLRVRHCNLHAAAPELLAALETCKSALGEYFDWYRGMYDADPRIENPTEANALEVATAAIAKATGATK